MQSQQRHKAEQPYIAPFIRRLMKDATEEEILEASDNLRQYLRLMQDIYERLEDEGKVDELLAKARERAAAETPEKEERPSVGFRLTQ